MAGVAPYGSLRGLVAVYAPLHLHGLLHGNTGHQIHVAMASRALNLRPCMLGVAEEDEIRNFIKPKQRNCPFLQFSMTNLALFESRESSSVVAYCIGVARNAAKLQRRVLLMIERRWFGTAA